MSFLPCVIRNFNTVEAMRRKDPTSFEDPAILRETGIFAYYKSLEGAEFMAYSCATGAKNVEPQAEVCL